MYIRSRAGCVGLPKAKSQKYGKRFPLPLRWAVVKTEVKANFPSHVKCFVRTCVRVCMRACCATEQQLRILGKTVPHTAYGVRVLLFLPLLVALAVAAIAAFDELAVEEWK